MSVNRDIAREAHREYDKTRCAGWLAATGHRPVSKTGIIAKDVLAKTPQPVARVAKPMPAYACDVHPIGELP